MRFEKVITLGYYEADSEEILPVYPILQRHPQTIPLALNQKYLMQQQDIEATL